MHSDYRGYLSWKRFDGHIDLSILKTHWAFEGKIVLKKFKSKSVFETQSYLKMDKSLQGF